MDLGKFLICQILVIILSEHDVKAERRCSEGRFGASCLYQCHCLNAAECDDVTGACAPSGCSPGWSGTSCQRRNLAYNMSADIRVSGDKGIGSVGTDGNMDTCVSSTPNRTGWWKVDLQRHQTVYGMRLYTGSHTFRSLGVYVSGYDDLFWSPPCTVLRNHDNESFFTCDKVMTGRYVGLMNKEGPITLCELEIFECADYTFGSEDCKGRCRCSDSLEVCDRVFGTCSVGCREGWSGPNCQQACNYTYGKNCVHRCGHCHGGEPCDVTTGRCDRCHPGWDGPTCHAKCPPGTHGMNCSEICGHCRIGSTCSSLNGNCVKGCAVAWKGPRCNQHCDAGEYGENCAFRCGHCAPGTACDPHTGRCQSQCRPGWEGLFCTQECLPGMYGVDCQQSCGKCLSQPCDPVNGSCGRHGCLHGYSGDTCKLSCTSGLYGPNCDQACGHCLDDAVCDPIDGNCSTTCDPGYFGDKCNQVCLSGTWGDNCSQTCGLCYQNKGCNPATGLCDEGCFEGYYGTYCEFAEEFQDLSSALVMPVMVITVVIVGFNLCLLFACLICKWKLDEKHIPRPLSKALSPLLPTVTVENRMEEL